MNSIQFEKDDDTSYHMDFIAGLPNMRARNYSIPQVDELKAKFIAGRINPAIVTSTAMATGLVYHHVNGMRLLLPFAGSSSVAFMVPLRVLRTMLKIDYVSEIQDLFPH